MPDNINLEFMVRAVELANQAIHEGNLPIAAVVTLDNKIIAEGKNSIWKPRRRPNRHAEVEALEAVAPNLWGMAQRMTLYTTLEPCVMCIGTILIHRIGTIVYGAKDIHGGATCILDHMPPAFKTLNQGITWIGPAMPDACNDLSSLVIAMSHGHRADKSLNWSIWDAIIDKSTQPDSNSILAKQHGDDCDK